MRGTDYKSASLTTRPTFLLLVPDFDEFSTQGDNTAVKYRTAHLQYLLDNNVFSLNSIDEWQPDLRRWTPSSNARYPLRMKKPKPPTDPDACKFTMGLMGV